MANGHDNVEERDWALEEFGAADLSDRRRTARLVQVARSLARQPEASIPQAMEDRAAIKAAYRFFDNADVAHVGILQSHVASSVQRMRSQPLILAVQDTTHVDYSGHPHTEGLGPVHTDGGWGLMCHGTLAFTPEGLPLGVLAVRTWARGEKHVRHTRRKRAIKDKESVKWLDSLRALAALKAQLPDTQLVSVADRESDIYEFFAEAQALGLDVLARAQHDRNIEQPEARLRARLAQAPVVGHRTLAMAATDKRRKRLAELEVRTCAVTIKAPRHRSSEKLPSIALMAVWAREPKPPPDEQPVEWLLYTTLPVESAEQALQMLDWYTVRWGIEIWHKVLKSGCRIEQRQLQSFERLERLFTVYAVIAWRILYATLLARTVPDMPCTAILQDDEWQALYCVIHHTPKPCATAPPIRQAVRWIAQLGGFIGRAGDGEPGVKTFWKGYQYLMGATDMYRIMKPPTPPPRRRSSPRKNVGKD